MIRRQGRPARPSPRSRHVMISWAWGVLSWRGCLALVQDPRDPRGVRHPLVSVLLIAVMAVLAGATNLLAIAERAANLSQEQLRRLGAWRHPRSGLWVARVARVRYRGDHQGSDRAADPARGYR